MPGLDPGMYLFPKRFFEADGLPVKPTMTTRESTTRESTTREATSRESMSAKVGIRSPIRIDGEVNIAPYPPGEGASAGSSAGISRARSRRAGMAR